MRAVCQGDQEFFQEQRSDRLYLFIDLIPLVKKLIVIARKTLVLILGGLCFRPGKAPRKLIEGMYGAEVFFEEAINIAFPDAYDAAVKEQELQVVGYPSVELVGEATQDGFTFKAVVPVYPDVTLGEYKGLSAPKDEVKVSAADVDERIKSLLDRNTRLVSVEREAQEGDTAVIDFEGFLDGVPFEGGKGTNHSLELGSHSFVPGAGCLWVLAAVFHVACVEFGGCCLSYLTLPD